MVTPPMRISYLMLLHEAMTAVHSYGYGLLIPYITHCILLELLLERMLRNYGNSKQEASIESIPDGKKYVLL